MSPQRNVINCEINNLTGKGTTFTRIEKEEMRLPYTKDLANITKEGSLRVNSSSNEWIQSKLHQQTEG